MAEASRRQVVRRVEIYDTTLRDGTQAEDFNLSLEDKIRITCKLDELGVDYIEGGWPGSNPRDVGYFKEIRNYSLKHAKVAAFAATHMARVEPAGDPSIQAIVEAQTPVATIFGKSWDVHVHEALRIPLERNLELIRNTLAFLRPKVEKLFFDAEHFFDGFKGNRTYALAAVKAALGAGADCIVLCDTNGGTLPMELADIIKAVQKKFTGINLGIHCHNDSEMAVANSVVAAALGATQIQGTINGFGERCGNANLCSIIPNLKLKLGLECISDAQLKRLSEVSRFVNELANVRHSKYQPYVGLSAFTHKAGVHIAAVERNPVCYEHTRPELVGNTRRILVSDLSGRSAVVQKAKQYGLDISSKDPVTLEILERIKDLEHQGFQFEGAEASFELLIHRALGRQRRYFELVSFRVIDQKVQEGEQAMSEATIRVRVAGREEHTAALGNGPVNALDNALRKALYKFYEAELKDVKLEDYKVRVLPGRDGTGSKVRVLIESGDKDGHWGTVGVSANIIEASYQALVDSINYKFLKDEKAAQKAQKAAEKPPKKSIVTG
jgi:2-isopropylmalate synthase